MRKRLNGFESLESRRLLTVTAELVGDDLVVTGDATDVVIKATAAGTFEVSDGGNLVATVEGVTDDVKIQLDADGAENNQVTLDLAGQSVDRVFVSLGDGDNHFTLQGGTVNGELVYVGGSDDDAVQIAADATVAGATGVRLGNGDNSVEINGTISRSLNVLAGSGDDLVTIAADAHVERAVNALLGNGDNTVTIGGTVSRELNVRGGVDDDTVTILAGAVVERGTSLCLGDGDNGATVDGTVNGNLVVSAGEGNDTVAIGAAAVIDKSVGIRLGEGTNSVDVAGTINGNLAATSANADDSFVVQDTATVVGTQNLTPGEQIVRGLFGRHGFRHFGESIGNAINNLSGGNNLGNALRNIGRGLFRR